MNQFAISDQAPVADMLADFEQWSLMRLAETGDEEDEDRARDARKAVRMHELGNF